MIKKGTFIVQKYIETRTIDGQPFDIRVHMMKDGNGEWSFVKIYPRIGVYYATIVATIKGGYIGNLDGFLQRNFGKEHVLKLRKQIEAISIKLATNFDKIYEENLNEIALDLAIDKTLNPKLIEINVNKPGIANYEYDVAKHAIEFAKYLIEKEINK